MMKRRISVIVAFGLMLAVALTLFGTTTSFAKDSEVTGKCGDNATFTLDSAGLLTISGTGTTDKFVCDGIHQWSVQASKVKNVVISSGITSIKTLLFEKCTNIESVIIPDSVTDIGLHPFNLGNKKLKTITVEHTGSDADTWAKANGYGVSVLYPYKNVVDIDMAKGIATVKNDYTGRTEVITLEIMKGDVMHRMYNRFTQEHLYTMYESEIEWLQSLGWIHETESDFGVADARDEDAIPVYRLYNPASDTHHYTEDPEEVKYDLMCGWTYERISHYVYNKECTKGVPQWRLYNPNSGFGEHNWTSNEYEVIGLELQGWNNEGIRWRVAN